MAIERIVNSKFTANDKITKRFGIMERAAARFGRRTEKSFKRASRSASRFKSVTGGVVAGLGITKGIGALKTGLAGLISEFVSFEKAARGATVRFKDIGPEAENFNQQMKIIRTSARAAGASTEFTATQAGEALDFLARAGFTSKEAMGSLRSMINLATASGEDFAAVADMSSDLLGAFGLNAKDTTQKIANLNRVNDVLVKTANSANVTVEAMFETMKEAAPIGRQLGIELEEIAALTAVMGNAGIKGSAAGTALKNAFLKLSAGGPKVTKMLDAIGVRINDGRGNMRKFTDILTDVGTNIKGLGTLKQSKVLDTLFGKRAIAGASNLIESIGEVKQFEQTLKNAGKTSEKTAEIMRQSLDSRLKTIQSSAIDVGFSILEAFEGNAKLGMDSLTEAIRNFDPQPIIDFFKIVLDGAKLIWEWRSAIMVAVGAFFALKAALLTVQAAMIVFNIAAAANPIGLIVLAVASLILGFSALVIWIDEVIAAFDSMPIVLRAILLPLKSIFTLIKFVKDNFGVITKFFGFGGKDVSKVGEGFKAPEQAQKMTSIFEMQSEREKQERSAPNRIEAALRAKNSTFKGRLDISGAPKGSKITTDQGSSDEIDFALLGA